MVPCKLEVEAKGKRRRLGEASRQWVAGYSLRFALLTDVYKSVRELEFIKVNLCQEEIMGDEEHKTKVVIAKVGTFRVISSLG